MDKQKLEKICPVYMFPFLQWTKQAVIYGKEGKEDEGYTNNVIGRWKNGETDDHWPKIKNV